MKEKLKKRKKRNAKEKERKKERQKEEKHKEMGIWILKWRIYMVSLLRKRRLPIMQPDESEGWGRLSGE